ncbi:PIG-L deacetylase family protein [Frigoriflavimonas asaccharolytica]|uniref:LmbE family N-acetylglucosaminyl deacetylase n=1 Tax=Frigoriflavimonas asaccharolytica TaxID=2735899 RepID=A0A8J8KAH7_9FLAO|nr:PIG-L family deacetylase [Frigoriflavimonas asaccharolytica]NRS94157.1 LmbE family N-acetylglucosaminyl deacetylase [Frigoriflavimonas asaccharolytica]
MKNLALKNISLAPEQCVLGFGTTIIVAPHADDESLGCGGVISLLKKYGQEVYILLLSDGTLSHPNSLEYPAEKLRDLRENELINAAAILGISTENLIFCRFKDRSIPNNESQDFLHAAQDISKVITAIKPQSIFVPWRRDPHPDHQAAYQIIDSIEKYEAKVYEYPIWLNEIGEEKDAPNLEEVTPFRLNIESVLEKKMQAIAAHKSQTTNLITDDPNGFMLSKEMINSFNRPYELFYISK